MVEAPPPPEGFSSAPPPPPEGFGSQEAPPPPEGFGASPSEHYSTTGQQIGAGLEGVAQGLAGPLAPMAELALSKAGVPGLSAEDQAGRANANPLTHGAGEAAGLVGGLLTGTGEAGLIGGIAEHIAPEAATVLGKVGSAALKSSIESGLFQSSDEITKSMLGQGDPQTPVASALANIGGATLLGGVSGGIFGGANAVADSQAESLKLGTRVRDFLAGVGSAAQPTGLEVRGSPAYKLGQKVYNEIPKIATTAATGFVLDRAISASGIGDLDAVKNNPGLRYAAETGAMGLLGPQIGKLTGRVISPIMSKAVVPAVLKVLSSGDSSGLFEAMDHAENVARGAKKMNDAVGNVFNVGAQRAFDYEATDRQKNKIKEYMDQGGVDAQMQNESSQGFAQGGPVEPKTDAISVHFPEQAMLMAAAKGRVSNYLNTVKPQKNAAKLPYDVDHNYAQQGKKYDRAVNIAANPLGILNKVKDGSLTTEELNHFHQMYPEVYTQLGKLITGKITGNQLSGEKPNYRTRQGLSLFMGTALDSSFTPQSIQAAQMTFVQQKAQASPPPGKMKRGTSKLGDSAKQFQTAEQAASERQTSEK